MNKQYIEPELDVVTFEFNKTPEISGPQVPNTQVPPTDPDPDFWG